MASAAINPLGPDQEIKYGFPISKGTPPIIFVDIAPSLDSKQLLLITTVFDCILGFTITSNVKGIPVHFVVAGVII